MAVIVREERRLGGVQVEQARVFRSVAPLTEESIAQAEEIDRTIVTKMGEIEHKMKENGLLGLKGQKGVIRLWYEVGKELEFVDRFNIKPEEDRKFIWQAIYDHAGGLLPGPGRSRRNRLFNNYFRYCHDLALFDRDFVLETGDWTSWVELFDSERIRRDSRIVEWLRAKIGSHSREWREFTKGTRQMWFRKLVREIRGLFAKRDTLELNDEELHHELEVMVEQLLEESSSSSKKD